MTFGSLTVISRAPNKKNQVYWNCQCSCGNTCCVRGDRLTASHIDGHGAPSCGHIQVERAAASVKKDLTGAVIGRLTVLRSTEERSCNGAVMWECQCKCGNTVLVPTDMLTRKNRPTQSCGCLQKDVARDTLKTYIDTISPHIGDNIFGFIVEDIKLEPTNNGQNESWIYAKCPVCGKRDWYKKHSIQSDGKRSCGCTNYSYGELKIQQILSENNIEYEREKVFPDLKDINFLRFDFYLPRYNTCIEYDGEQHYRPINFGGRSDEESKQEFQKTQKRDALKNEYCLQHHIALIRIPYTQYDLSLIHI